MENLWKNRRKSKALQFFQLKMFLIEDFQPHSRISRLDIGSCFLETGLIYSHILVFGWMKTALMKKIYMLVFLIKYSWKIC